MVLCCYNSPNWCWENIFMWLVSLVKEGSNCVEKKVCQAFYETKFWSQFSEHSTTYLKKQLWTFYLGNRHSYVENTRKIKKNIFDIYLCTTCWKNFKHHLGLISDLAMRLKIMIQFISNHLIDYQSLPFDIIFSSIWIFNLQSFFIPSISG